MPREYAGPLPTKRDFDDSLVVWLAQQSLTLNDANVSGTVIADPLFRLPVKTTTGDPASPSEGDMYVNTFDNAVRVFADAAWRDLATW